MAVWLITIILSSLVFAGIVLVLLKVHTPRYRVEQSKVKTLLYDVVNGNATEDDWQIFIGIPILHDERLEAIRQRCIELDTTAFIGCSTNSNFFLTAAAIEEIRQMLLKMEGDIVLKG